MSAPHLAVPGTAGNGNGNSNSNNVSDADPEVKKGMDLATNKFNALVATASPKVQIGYIIKWHQLSRQRFGNVEAPIPPETVTLPSHAGDDDAFMIPISQLGGQDNNASFERKHRVAGWMYLPSHQTQQDAFNKVLVKNFVECAPEEGGKVKFTFLNEKNITADYIIDLVRAEESFTGTIEHINDLITPTFGSKLQTDQLWGEIASHLGDQDKGVKIIILTMRYDWVITSLWQKVSAKEKSLLLDNIILNHLGLYQGPSDSVLQHLAQLHTDHNVTLLSRMDLNLTDPNLINPTYRPLLWDDLDYAPLPKPIKDIVPYEFDDEYGGNIYSEGSGPGSGEDSATGSGRTDPPKEKDSEDEAGAGHGDEGDAGGNGGGDDEETPVAKKRKRGEEE